MTPQPEATDERRQRAESLLNWQPGVLDLTSLEKMLARDLLAVDDELRAVKAQYEGVLAIADERALQLGDAYKERASLEAERDVLRGVDRQAVVDAMQLAWDDFVADTGCFPDILKVDWRRREIGAEFGIGNFASSVAEILTAGRTRVLSELGDQT